MDSPHGPRDDIDCGIRMGSSKCDISKAGLWRKGGREAILKHTQLDPSGQAIILFHDFF